MNNIILCGFMGCGKTTVGKELAQMLNREFIDMDCFIAEKMKMSICDIFKLQGEEYFRFIETAAAKELSEKSNLIISTGGGSVLFCENVSYFKAGGKIVFLDVPLNIIKERLKNDTSRPLLNRTDKDEAMTELFSIRRPTYLSAADLVVKYNDENLAKNSFTEVSENICLYFGR